MCSHVAVSLLKSCVLLASLVEFFWSVAFFRSNFCSNLFVMAEEHIWISAQIPHPFKLGYLLPGVLARNTSAWCGGSRRLPSPGIDTRGFRRKPQAAMAGVHPSTRMNVTVGVVSLRRGCLHVRSHLRRPDERIPTTTNVQLPPGISSLPTSDVDGPLSGFRQVDCSLRLRADDAFSSYREDDISSVDGWRIQQSCQASRRDTLHFSPFRRLRAYCRVLDRLFRRSPVPALKSDQPNWRPL